MYVSFFVVYASWHKSRNSKDASNEVMAENSLKRNCRDQGMLSVTNDEETSEASQQNTFCLRDQLKFENYLSFPEGEKGSLNH